jgi:hypothetical protein
MMTNPAGKPKREAILHIGTWKTGTKTIQDQLNRRRPELIDQGAAYPITPGAHSCLLLTYAAARGRYHPEEYVWNGMEPEARLEQFAGEFADEMASLPDHVDRVIFSDERMSTALRNVEEVQRLRDILDPWFDKFLIVIYLRRQDQFMASLYTQILRTGVLDHPDDIYDKPILLRPCDYWRTLSCWWNVFRPPNVRPRIYEKRDGKNFDSLIDFFTLCRLKPPGNDGKVIRRNQGISEAGQAVLREAGRLMLERHKLQPKASTGRPIELIRLEGPQWDALTRLVTNSLPGKGWAPTREQAEWLLTRYAKGNEVLRKRYYPDRETLFSMDFSDLPETRAGRSDAICFEAACTALVEASFRQAETVKPVVKPQAARVAGAEVRRPMEESADDPLLVNADDEV